MNRTGPDVTIHYAESFAGFPDAIRLAGGELLVLFREDSQHQISATGRVLCRRSRDRGHTWEDPVLVSDHEGTDDRDPFACQVRDGTVWVGLQGQRPHDYDSYVTWSEDSGASWQAPRLVGRAHDEHFVEYPMLEMSNGEFLWIGCTGFLRTENGHRTWFAGKPGNDRATFILTDPWEQVRWRARVHPQLGSNDEWDVVETDAGHLIAILRHGEGGNCYYYQSESNDYGHTWSASHETTIWHGPAASRPTIDVVDDGVLVVSYADRRSGTILAIPSFDGGASWDVERIVTVLDDAAYCDPESGDFGYPALVDAGTDYLFVYYAFPGGSSPHRGIYGTFVSRSTFSRP